MLSPRQITTTFLSGAAALLSGSMAFAQSITLPEPESADFCVAVQQVLANTEVEATNTIFDNMPDYRSSKPSVSPLKIYQVVSYSGEMPVIVSCKIKAADHLQSEYGEDAAGKQRFCPEISKLALQQAITQLQTENPAAAEAASQFIVDDTEPYSTGQSYLGDWQAISRDAEGVTRVTTPSLQTNWENWMFWILPDRLRGQTYCHIPTVNYLKAVASGTVEPGATMTTADDAPNQPTAP
jgi:hypothetical protein